MNCLFNTKSILVSCVFLALIVMAGSPAAALPETVDGDKLIRYGDHFLDKGNLERALSCYKRALPLTSRHKVYVITQMGIVYKKMDKPKLAFKYLNEALSKDPKFGKAYTARGDTYADIYKYDKAVVEYDKALKYRPTDSVDILRKRALANQAMGKSEVALSDLQKAIAVYPKYYKKKNQSSIARLAELYDTRGKINYNSKNYQKAINDFTERLKIKGFSDQVYQLRADCYEKMGRYELGLKDYSKIIQINPNDESAYTARGKLYDRMGKFGAAVDDFSRAIKNYPGENPSKIYLLRSASYKKLGKAREANADLARARKLDGGHQEN